MYPRQAQRMTRPTVVWYNPVQVPGQGERCEDAQIFIVWTH